MNRPPRMATTALMANLPGTVAGGSAVTSVVGVSTAATVVVVISIVASVAVLVVLFVQWYPRKVATDEPAAERGPRGPTGAAYPPGARPGGPGAEGMNVPAPGDISPSPPPSDEAASERDALDRDRES